MKDIDADFYGYRIEDDGTILHDEYCKEIESVSNFIFINYIRRFNSKKYIIFHKVREKKKNDQLNHLSQQAICSMNETASEVNDVNIGNFNGRHNFIIFTSLQGSIDKAENEEFTCMAYFAVPTQKEVKCFLCILCFKGLINLLHITDWASIDPKKEKRNLRKVCEWRTFKQWRRNKESLGNNIEGSLASVIFELWLTVEMFIILKSSHS